MLRPRRRPHHADGPRALDDKMRARMLKLRKGAVASISMRQLIEVLNLLGGWRVEPMVGLVQLHGFNAPLQDEPHLEPGGLYEWAKKHEVRALPRVPKLGETYTMDVTEPTSKGFAKGFVGIRYRSWKAVRGLRFTSPDGAVHDLRPGKYDVDKILDPLKMHIDFSYGGQSLGRWLAQDTRFPQQVSDALGMESPEAEREGKKPRTRENTGTCPACFRNIKLKPTRGEYPLIVLHGYQRPGWGQIEGECFGVNYPPFELSPTGTRALVTHLREVLASVEQYLARLRAGDVTYMPRPRRGAFDKGPAMVTRETARKETGMDFKTLIDRAIPLEEERAHALQRDIGQLSKLVANWRLEPLPMEGGKIAPPPTFLR